VAFLTFSTQHFTPTFASSLNDEEIKNKIETMKCRNRIGTVICICLALFSSIANAQELIQKELSLNDAITMAMENHKQLKI